jgi:hypothetical protein
MVPKLGRATLCGGALLCAASAFAGCGGTDHGRPQASVPATPLDAGIDPDTSCDAAAGLTLQTITDFEPPPGSNPALKPSAVCDTSIDATKSACMYFNYDTEQSPRLCSSSTPSLATCVQANGAPEPASFCMDSNITAPGQSVIVSPIPGGRCGTSNNAFHLAASNIAACYDPTTEKQGWGITLQITFNPSPQNSGLSQKVFDASTWDGIAMWVRRGSASSGSAVLVSIEDPYTANASGASGFTHIPTCTDAATSPDAGANCFIQCGVAHCLTSMADCAAQIEPAIPGMPPTPDAQKCDPFSAGVGFTTDWRFVKVPFARTEQKGFGVPSAFGQLDTSALVGMQLVLTAGDWDVWIDDIAFYREPS